MKTTFNDLKAKKGNKIFLVGSWNGNEKETLDFYIIQWTVLSSGKQRTYLTSDNGTSKKSYYSRSIEFIVKDNYQSYESIIAEAIEDCKTIAQQEIERIESSIKFYSTERTGFESHIESLKKIVDNIKTAPKRLLVFNKWYSNGTSEIKETISI